MNTLTLDPATRRYLTCESLDANKNPSAVPCNIKGKPLGSSEFPIPVFSEVGTGKPFARICALKPSNQDPASVAQKEAIEQLNPVFADGSDGTMRGWYIPAPDFSLKVELAAGVV